MTQTTSPHAIGRGTNVDLSEASPDQSPGGSLWCLVRYSWVRKITKTRATFCEVYLSGAANVMHETINDAIL